LYTSCKFAAVRKLHQGLSLGLSSTCNSFNNFDNIKGLLVVSKSRIP
jgi:hypothetical protein